MHYVIGDIHGCHSEMMKMLEIIESQDEDALIYFVGDFIDRGPDTKKVLDWCLENIKEDGKYQSVLGNHEFEILEWYENTYQPYLNGEYRYPYRENFVPYTHYDFSNVIKENDLNSEKKIAPYIEFMKSLPSYIDLIVQDKQYRIIHGWYNFQYPQINEKTYWMVWTRNSDGNPYNDVTIVYGHTPTISKPYSFAEKGDRPGKICYRHNAINVDGGCVFGKKRLEIATNLCAICLETGEEFYVPTIHEEGTPYDRIYEAQKNPRMNNFINEAMVLDFNIHRALEHAIAELEKANKENNYGLYFSWFEFMQDTCEKLYDTNEMSSYQWGQLIEKYDHG